MSAKNNSYIALVLSGLMSLVSSLAVGQATAEGSLFIIGGGSRPVALISKMVETAKPNTQDYAVVLTMASGEPKASFDAISGQLQSAGLDKVFHFNFDSISVDNLAMVDSLLHAKLIYITGGDQNRFMNIVRGSAVYEAIHQAYKNGSTIAGTSAGAAVMSKRMISGAQLRGDTSYRATFEKVWAENIEFQEGLGLVDDIIIDQHFIKRSRYNRLLSALAAYPEKSCIGIDESTAIIVHNGQITVTGESQVVVFSRPETLRIRDGKLISFEDLKFGLYADGDVIPQKN